MKKSTPLAGGGIAAAVALSLLAPAAASADDAAPAEAPPAAEAATTVAVAEPAVETPVEVAAEIPAPTETAPETAPETAAPEPAETVAAEASPAPYAAPAPAAFIAGRQSVTVTITDPDGNPVANASVDAISRVSGLSVRSAVSTSTGVAVLSDLEYGDYQFAVFAPLGRNDLDDAWLGGGDSTTATIVTVSYAGASSFSVQLPAAAAPVGVHRVSGRVVNTAGDPIEAAQVSVYNATNAQLAGSAYTDLDGYYTISGIGDGDFIVASRHLSGQGGSDLYYPGYYGGPNEPDADVITFTPSSPDATGIDIQTSMFGVEALVHVRVTDPVGDPVHYARVRVFDGSGALVDETTTDSRGDGDFEDLSAGEEYEIHVSGPVNSALLATSFSHTVAAGREAVLPVQLLLGDLDANDDEYTFDAGVLFDSGADAGVRANDTPGDLLAVELLSEPDYGSEFELHADGRFTYLAADGFDGLDSFTYRLVGPNGLVSGSTTVILNIEDDEPVAPTAVDDAYATPHGTPLVVAAPGVLGNDIAGGYPLVRVYEVVEDVDHGTLVIDSDGSFTYTPDPGFSGTDTFRYTSEDGVSTSGAATVTITVGTAPATGSPTASGLASTGSSPWLAGLAGALVLGAGATLAAVGRRRRDA